MEQTLIYSPDREEAARAEWYLQSRDQFVASLLIESAGDRSRSVRVLDAGCGIGGLLDILQRQGIHVVGIDGSFSSLQWGRQCRRASHVLAGDILRLPFADRSFDYVVSSEVLEHVEEDLAGLKELLRVSREGVLITVPAHSYLWTDSDDILLHKRRYSRESLRTLIGKAGGNIVRFGCYGLCPGLLLIAYKAAVATLGQGRGAKPSETRLPLASRYRTPGAVNATLRLLLRGEAMLARRGLLPWGQSWWAYSTKA